MNGRAPRTTTHRVVFAGAAMLACAGLLALGNWQVSRLAWKRELMARVEQRIHAPPAAISGPAEWPRVSAERDEYRRVRVSGTLLHEHETLVQASTELGAGWWVLTPLRTADAAVVLVNRGFVPPARRARASRSAGEATGEVTITGLLRITEPGGGFLHRNDAAADRWYSRDVLAIARARGLDRVAPYFIDAEAAPGQAGAGTGPTAGLTVTSFSNNHLAYAITWYTLAAMAALAAWRVAWAEHRPPDRVARTPP